MLPTSLAEITARDVMQERTSSLVRLVNAVMLIVDILEKAWKVSITFIFVFICNRVFQLVIL